MNRSSHSIYHYTNYIFCTSFTRPHTDLESIFCSSTLHHHHPNSLITFFSLPHNHSKQYRIFTHVVITPVPLDNKIHQTHFLLHHKLHTYTFCRLTFHISLLSLSLKISCFLSFCSSSLSYLFAVHNISSINFCFRLISSLLCAFSFLQQSLKFRFFTFQQRHVLKKNALFT